jgi:hypothetical protein
VSHYVTHLFAIADPVRLFKESGHDLATIPIARLPNTFTNVALLCANTYCSYGTAVGVGPINDAFLIANCLRQFEFDIYATHNPHSRNFLQPLDLFFAGTVRCPVLYSVGQGAGLRTAAEGGDVLERKTGVIGVTVWDIQGTSSRSHARRTRKARRKCKLEASTREFSRFT